jgi:hypothetical protein
VTALQRGVGVEVVDDEVVTERGVVRPRDGTRTDEVLHAFSGAG